MIPHGQSSLEKGEMPQVHPGRPGHISQSQFPKKSFQGAVINLPDLPQSMGVKTAGEEVTSNPDAPAPAIKCSMRFSLFSNCQKPRLWGFSGGSQ